MSIFGIDLASINFTDPEAITGAVLVITTLGSSISTAVASMQKKLNTSAVKLIGRAEEKFEYGEDSGEAKHDYVVNKLYMSIPLALRPLFPKQRLEGLVNNTFKNVNHFSELRMEYNVDDNVMSSALPEEAATATNVTEANPSSGPHIENNSDETEMSDVPDKEDVATIIPDNNQIKFKRGVKGYGTKAYIANQQMPCDGVLQDGGVQNSVRVHTFWSGHDFVCRTEYRVRKRKRNGCGHRSRQPAGQCRNCTL